ncbi:MAG: MotA/TolQ/ExbB proton channel family protein [Candidatus Aureabacteria bacterium]|nr:MotA/TolQ/ExbB proton channel family protein [Candidatus Auribacterota bacterium]
MKKTLCCLLAVIFIVLVASAAFCQEPAQDDSAQKGKTLWQTVKEGGIMMIIIGLVSVVMVYIIIRSFMTLSREKLIPSSFLDSIEKDIDGGNLQGVANSCVASDSFFAKILLAGLKKAHLGRDNMEKAIEERGEREGEALKVMVNYLSVIATIAPMLGLLGTVSGMIKSFNAIAFAGAAGKPSLLASSVGEALVTTAFGLIVAIPAMAFYFYFKTHIANLIAISEEKVEVIIDKIYSRASYRSGTAEDSQPEDAQPDARAEETPEEENPQQGAEQENTGEENKQ